MLVTTFYSTEPDSIAFLEPNVDNNDPGSCNFEYSLWTADALVQNTLLSVDTLTRTITFQDAYQIRDPLHNAISTP